MTPTPTAKSNNLADIKPKDCVQYDPARLQIVNEGASGWLLTDGVSRMHLLDSNVDAQAALAVAGQHTADCFIGRANTRPNRSDYIVEYWSGDSGRSAVIRQEDCISYRTGSLNIVNEGVTGWVLTDGVSRILILDNQKDAGNALILARSFSKLCFIGRTNTRPDRRTYILEYWE